MKISNRQAEVLAKEIVDQLKAKKPKMPSELEVKIRQWKRDRVKLEKDKAEAEKMLDKHTEKLKTVIGKAASSIRGYWDEDNIVEKLSETSIPTIKEVEDEIILKSMFKSDDDMQTFVNSLLKKYEKKMQLKISQS
jgi:hypothetical protein